jgi:hypothetical protein
MDVWLGSYLRQTPRRWRRVEGDIHLLLCVADHYEPNLGGASDAIALRRVEQWVANYPRRLGGFRDSDGRPPRHSFFYPIETYHADHIDLLGELCQQGYGEVEIHLHHHNDTAENLRATLLEARDIFAQRHRQLALDRRTREVKYGFIHGNWALDNSHPNGCWCGVDNELDILRQTGCYADFTLPAAPDRAQTRTINSIYYAVGVPGRRKSHDTGTPAGTRRRPGNSLMSIQGPLVLNWSSRKWGVIPKVENGCIQGNQPPSITRLRNWLRAKVQVQTRPDWYFVKLHTHGANATNMEALFGEPAAMFHRDLAQLAAENPRFHYHYVTAREMFNLARAAEDGWTGTIADARDYELEWCGSKPAKPPMARVGGPLADVS